MINKLKTCLEQANETVTISNEEAAKIFKVLLAVGAVLDDQIIGVFLAFVDDRDLNSVATGKVLVDLANSWEEMAE